MFDGPTPLQILEDLGSFGAYQIGQVALELFLCTIDVGGQKRPISWMALRISGLSTRSCNRWPS